MKYDFAGYATRNDLKCSDGRIIRDGAFKECDGMTVPLVWNHDHNSMNNVLGHALLEYRPGKGMYTYGKFNESDEGRDAKLRVENGDITSLSIYANQLQQQGPNVLHGAIREVSLVLAGANPGAYIETVMAHGEEDGECAEIYSGEEFAELEGEVNLSHANKEEPKDNKEETVDEIFETLTDKQKKAVYAMIGHRMDEQDDEKEDTVKTESKEEDKDVNQLEHADKENGKTVGEVFNTLTEEQKKAVYAMIGYLMEEKDDTDEEDDKEMKHNVFDNYGNEMDGDALKHSEALQTILNDGKKYGSLKESFLAHAAEYGIDSIDYLFPDAKNQNIPPEFIDRDTTWVDVVMSGVSHTPFSRVKSMFADITEDEARAKGYIKGRFKKNEVFSLLRRITNPTTVYKKQKLDRDDVVDITDFDVVAWLKTEMRGKLNEELARAFLIGDGRLSDSEDKIDETCIRPIWTDHDLFTVKANVSMAGGTDPIKNFIDTCILSRSMYKGSGNPTLFTTEAVLTRCLLLEDGFAHKLYKSVAELASAIRVKNIVTVESMEGVSRTPEGGTEQVLLGIIVNLADYNVGADRGGQVNMFDDFDIDYNAQKYLIETRCSGALIKPFAAIAIEGSKSAYNTLLSPLYFSPVRRAAIDAAKETNTTTTTEEEQPGNGQS